MSNVFIDGGDNSGTLVKVPRRTRSVARLRKKRSTMLNQDAEVGVKCMLKRGVLRQPFLDCWMLVRRVVVGDQVQGLVLRRLAIDLAQELQPFSHSVCVCGVSGIGR